MAKKDKTIKSNKTSKDKTIRSKGNKTSVITVRVTEKEKKRLRLKAKDSDTDVSKYLISSAFNNRRQKEGSMQTDIYHAAMAQEICNHISEKYGNDETLEKWRRELWERLRLK